MGDIEDTVKSEEDLKDMVGGARNYIVPNLGDAGDSPPDGSGDESILSQKLLQILNSNINNIVVEFKQALGNNNQAVNGSVATIVGILDTLSDDINNININNPVSIDRDIGNTIVNSNVDIRNGLGNTFPLYNNELINTINGNPTGYANIFSIDNVNQYNDGSNINNAEILELNVPNNILRLQDRLNNCSNLEHLYLTKHIELMKIFAFTINLFDKYKYAIKIVLFLLKYLVNKNKEEPNCGSIQLPPPLIPKINDLVIDQAVVQEVITNMKNTLNNNPGLTNLHQQATQKFSNPGVSAVNNLTNLNVPGSAP